MKLRLDQAACQGHGRCYSLSPELFGCDDDGQAILLVDELLTPGQERSARLAVDSCPEYAISVQ